MLSVPMPMDGRWCYVKGVLCVVWSSHLGLLVMKSERLVWQSACEEDG